MKRKEFLRGLGLAGVSSLIASKGVLATKMVPKGPLPPNCVLIPSETAGPFPLDLTENQNFFRQDVREDREGAEHHLKLKIIGLENCLPMPNVRVNIWHCDKDGNYSGYGTETGLTYLRGYQWTDANGECSFTTIFPGWYNGRICHIHFQVWVSSVYAAVSQLTYPLMEKNDIYAAYPSLYTKGADPLNFNQDGIFADGYSYQLASLTENTSTQVWESYLEVTVQGSGITGLAQATPETGGHFTLLQNQPNPFAGKTSVPFILHSSADVNLELWSLAGKKVAEIKRAGLSSGSHQIDVDLAPLGLPHASYVFQLVVKNAKGKYYQAKVMTALV
jgi:hypothetical protein